MNVKKIVEENFNTDKRVDYLKYINTFGIALVTFFGAYISMDLKEIKSNVEAIKSVQAVQASEMIRLKTVQDINTTNIGNIHTRVFNLEVNQAEQMKQYMEANFVRKK